MRHENAYLLGEAVFLGTQVVCLLYGAAVFGIELYYLVDKGELGVLKLVSYILLYDFGIFANKSDVQHFYYSFPLFISCASCACMYRS